MKNTKEQPKPKKDTPHPPLKPKHSDTKGAPDNNDPQAQYEDKDES